MTDENLSSADFRRMVEDNPHQKIQSKRKTFASKALVSKKFCLAQLKMSNYSEEFIATDVAFPDFLNNFWKSRKPAIALTDNKLVTRFLFKREQFRRRSGLHVIVRCNLISKWHTLLVQPTQSLTFSLDYNSKLRKGYVSKSKKTY